MEGFFRTFSGFRPQDLLDIALLTLIFYRLLIFIKGTRTIPILMGLTVLLATYAMSNWMSLDAIGWLLENLFSSVVVILVVLFQSDIRNALARVGMTTMFKDQMGSEKSDLIAEVAMSAFTLARRRIGATIVMENETGLRNFIERGRAVNAQPTTELLESIFHTSSPLHDGAVIINRQGQLAAARCILPLTSNIVSSSFMGTRHRSAIGITEETDAVAVVVSEERGVVSLAYRGKLEKNMDESELRRRINQILLGKTAEEHDHTEAPAHTASA
ncbi:MAG: diadenylate cyclase CdaA [Deltaproteobacteria bacterium]|nr:diadenylate cyclase CdaA [Deltaproteobacteria bacterium]